MTQPWTFSGAPAGQVPVGAVTLLEGSTFAISAPNGDIVPGHAQGLFVRDTRVLSRWTLTVDGRCVEPLTVQAGEPYTAAFIGRVTPTGHTSGSDHAVVRRRYVGNGLREDVSVQNLNAASVAVTVVLEFDADFADLFEVKEGRTEPADDVAAVAAPASVRIEGTRRARRCSVIVRGDQAADTGPRHMVWQPVIAGHATWSVSLEVVPASDEGPMVLRHPRGRPVHNAVPARMLRAWRRRSPSVSTGDRDLAELLRRSVEDLGALRIFDPAHPARAVVAAGAPWFMALFGRDSLLTSYMLLPLNAELAVGTLQTLADRQGTAVDHTAEEEPGRILHEVRFGPATLLAMNSRGVYYGTVDATALFVMLVSELHRWGRHGAEVQALVPHADRALRWIEDYGDADGDGFVEYARKTAAGLVNQGWKDSHDGINFADGRLADGPIALAEVQAYTYAAYRGRAAIAADQGEAAAARHWRDKAARLKRAFNDAFWLPRRGWFAVALDGDKRPVDALTSNIGHCLWTGIVERDKAAAVAEHLLSPQMFTGWGIRTLGATMGAYNPISYHNGSVWPHDTAICVAGLMRYGFVDHAQRVASGLLDTAAHFDHQLPELFCGFSRADFEVPVPYPTSCAPQAWASAAPLLILRSLLRFEPRVPEDTLGFDPAVPDRYLPLHVRGVQVGEHRVDLHVDAEGWTIDGLTGTGLRLRTADGRGHDEIPS